MTLKQEWLAHCTQLSQERAGFYSGYRKIHPVMRLSFSKLDDSLKLSDVGYTKMKLSGLTRHYLHEESRSVALQLWEKRKDQEKYGSVGFTCYNHFVKGGSVDAKRAKRASVFGPCIQSVVITWLSRTSYSVDVFYRTTEFYKKFPADLILLRDVLLEPFDFEGMTMSTLNCHFANITCHPMYIVTVLGLRDDPIRLLEFIRKDDPVFFQKCINWTAHYICPEFYTRIEKYSQAKRVHMHAQKSFDKPTMKALQVYLRKHHKGKSGG